MMAYTKTPTRMVVTQKMLSLMLIGVRMAPIPVNDIRAQHNEPVYVW